MGFFGRLWNTISGFFGSAVSSLEESNPTAVYESAIQERIKMHQELKEALSGVASLRNKTKKSHEENSARLETMDFEIDEAINAGDDELAEALSEENEVLLAKVAEEEKQLQLYNQQYDETMAAVQNLRAEIDKLKREKNEMQAKLKSAEASIQMKESLSDLSLEANSQALSNVREAIAKSEAEASISAELSGESASKKMESAQKLSASERAKKRLAARKARLNLTSEDSSAETGENNEEATKENKRNL